MLVYVLKCVRVSACVQVCKHARMCVRHCPWVKTTQLDKRTFGTEGSWTPPSCSASQQLQEQPLVPEYDLFSVLLAPSASPRHLNTTFLPRCFCFLTCAWPSHWVQARQLDLVLDSPTSAGGLCLHPQYSTQHQHQVIHNVAVQAGWSWHTGTSTAVIVTTSSLLGNGAWKLPGLFYSPFCNCTQSRVMESAKLKQTLQCWCHPPRSALWPLSLNGAPVEAGFPTRCVKLNKWYCCIADIA
jgi:hypothetical protein